MGTLIEPIPALQHVDGVVAGFTTRSGGVSGTPFDSLNLAVSSGDDESNVWTNRRRLLAHVGFGPGAIAIAGQVHGSHVARVDEPGLVTETDGLVTTTPGLLLGIVAADCAVVLVADDAGTIVGAAHAGWRGAAGGIVGNLVAAMRERGVRPDQLSAWVSPCISQANFEVGDEVAEQFDQSFVVENPASGKKHVDLTGALVGQLITLGIPPARIAAERRCTVHETEAFFSYRGESGRTGRMMGFIGIR